MGTRNHGEILEAAIPDCAAGLTPNLRVFTPPHSVPVLLSHSATLCPVKAPPPPPPTPARGLPGALRTSAWLLGASATSCFSRG